MFAQAPEWPSVRSIPVTQLREMVRQSSLAIPGPNVALANIADREIPGPGGPLPIRTYTPLGIGPHPVIVYFHGGGWVVGDLDTQDAIARALAAGAESIVISVDYRLAPEHPFPAAPEDAWAATQWAARNAASSGGDAARIAVAGGSAGGVLACVVALMARDSGDIALRAQVNFYGSCNFPSHDTPSAREFAQGPILTSEDIDFYWEQYLSDPAQQGDFRASPFRASSHVGLPPAFIGTAEIDPSRDDAEAYAAKLDASGVQVELRRYAGMIHGFASWVGILPTAQQALADACAFLKRQFERTSA